MQRFVENVFTWGKFVYLFLHTVKLSFCFYSLLLIHAFSPFPRFGFFFSHFQVSNSRRGLGTMRVEMPGLWLLSRTYRNDKNVYPVSSTADASAELHLALEHLNVVSEKEELNFRSNFL